MRRFTSSMFLAGAAAVALAVPAFAADGYYYRAKPLVDPQTAFSFAPAPGREQGEVVASAPAALKGFAGRTASISSGEYQVCAAADCSDQTAWKSGPTAGLPAAFYVRVRATAPAWGQTASARLTVGDRSAPFEVTTRAKDETPDPVTFADATATVGTEVRSEIRQLRNHDGVYLTVNGPQPYFRICADATCSTNPGFVSGGINVARDSWVQLMQQYPPYTVGDTAVSTLSYGTLKATWAVKSVAAAPKYQFTTCGATGYLGPTLSQCQASYGSGGPTVAMTTQGKQEWTVPETGTYRITAAGAKGGDTTTFAGGAGLLQTVDVSLTAGLKLTIFVGQAGKSTTQFSLLAAGGGGATGVVSSNGILVVSGGGGGGGYQTGNVPVASGVGRTATDSVNGSTAASSRFAGAGSGSGTGLCTTTGSTGGAGFNSASTQYDPTSYGAANGALSGSAIGSRQRTGSGTGDTGSGGFGGGGAGQYGGGGGGGYSGGGCGDYQTVEATGGGAGGSIYTGTRVSVSTNNAAGYVEIERR